MVHEWLSEQGASQVRQKQKHLAEIKAATADRLKQGYEGQVVMVDGTVAEVRGLMTPECTSSADSVCVLPYDLVSRESRSQTTWQLSHTAQLKLVKEDELRLVDWLRVPVSAKLQIQMQ